MQHVKIAVEITAPKTYLELKVTRKPGDVGWIKSSMVLSPHVSHASVRAYVNLQGKAGGR